MTIQNLQLTVPPHRGHVTVLKLQESPPNGGFQVDSFFDITYQIELPSSPPSIDSFFDITYRIGATSTQGWTGSSVSYKEVDRSTPLLMMTVGGDPNIFLEATIENFEHTLTLLPDGRLGIMHWNHDPATPRGPSMTIRPRPM